MNYKQNEGEIYQNTSPYAKNSQLVVVHASPHT